MTSGLECTNLAAPGQLINSACTLCGHAAILHPGHANPSLTACIICLALNTLTHPATPDEDTQ